MSQMTIKFFSQIVLAMYQNSKQRKLTTSPPSPLSDTNEVGLFQQKVQTITVSRHLWFWKCELFYLLGILTLGPRVESFSRKFNTFFRIVSRSINRLKLSENRISSQFVSSRQPRSEGECKVITLGECPGCLLDTYFEQCDYPEVYDG